MRLYHFFFFCLLNALWVFLIGCSGSQSNYASNEDENETFENHDSEVSDIPQGFGTIVDDFEYDSLFEQRQAEINGIGVLVFNDSLCLNNGTFIIHNLDSSRSILFDMVNMQVAVGETIADAYNLNESSLSGMYGIYSRIFLPEYSLVHFEVIEMKDGIWVINSPLNQGHVLADSESCFEYYNWSDYLKNLYLNFDSINIYDEPDGSFNLFTNSWRNVFRGTEVRGDWVYIVCDSTCMPCQEKNGGWIRWRKNNEILLTLGVDC